MRLTDEPYASRAFGVVTGNFPDHFWALLPSAAEEATAGRLSPRSETQCIQGLERKSSCLTVEHGLALD